MSEREPTTRKKEFTVDATLIFSEARKNELRQSEDYRKTKEILDRIVSKIPISYPRTLATYEAKIFEYNCLEFYEKWKETRRISGFLRGLETQVHYPSDVYKSMNKLLVYLGLVESLGVALLDMTLILLIASGEEVHTRGPYTKHVKFFKELEGIDLGYKLDLLEDEGLGLVKKLINRDLRNHIAHLKLRIQNNGEIRKRDGSLIDIDANISRFWDSVDIIELIIEDSGFLKSLETLSSITREE